MRYNQIAKVAAGLLAATALSSPALAGETILYGDAGAWVDVPDLPPPAESQGNPLRLFDMQTRLEDGIVSSYGDFAFALESAEMLGAMGTVTLSWLPDKGDLTVHRVELVRGGEVIDLLANGAEFEVLRRERQLEQRIIDGALTATMSVPGAKIGDTLRYSFTVTKDEQVLGEDMEYLSPVLADPTPLAEGRVIVSWPEGEDVRWSTTRVGSPVEEATRGGYQYVSIALPVAEPDTVPQDAPPRFRLPPAIRVSTFDSYAQISQVIAPYFATEGTIAAGSTLADKVAEIAAQTSDPLKRAALATQFVQDEVGYLMNGLDGGNYIPQSPAETWEARTGDCKAKSLLLLSMLRELGISAEAVLVHSTVGDALPEVLPALGNFDHVIVRADIGGEPYWLDGTSSGLRLANIVEVPRFRYGLPLRSDGAGLQELAMRPQTLPDHDIRLTMDQSAGIDLPAIYEVEWRVSGAAARNYQTLALLDDTQVRNDQLESAMNSLLGANLPASVDVTYDDESGIAVLKGRGLIGSPWAWDNGRMELDVPYQELSNFSFDIARDRATIADMPVTVNGPLYSTRKIEWRLPQADSAFRVIGGAQMDAEIGGTQVVASQSLEDGRLLLDQGVRSIAWEVPASDLPQIRRDTLRMQRGLPRLVAPRGARMAWDYHGRAASLADPIGEMYDTIIARESDDEQVVDLYRERAYFRYRLGDFEGALADYSQAVDRDPSAMSYSNRAYVLLQTGDIEGALDDFETAADLDPEYGLTEGRFVALKLLGREEEAVPLADEFAVFEEEASDQAQQRGYAMGWAGRVEEGAQVFEEELEFSPEDAGLLNASCWYDGIWDRASEETVERCSRAIEGMENSVTALDSRALALYRLGRTDEALRDLDRVLARAPELFESRFLRAVIRAETGDAAGAKEDLEIVRRAAPFTIRKYALWGLTPG
tara:strand:- start:2959 stop:5769 length:2811 start_codon:yes stop_codon:yes gene_type:complete